MYRFSRLFRGLAALCLATTGLTAHATYSSMYVFGDSLSDVGNDLLISSPYIPTGVPNTSIFTDGTNTGRFTNGLNYVDSLAGYLGLSALPSQAGGTVYAYGGARVNSITPALAPLGGLGFNQQVSSYVSSLSGPVDPNALFVLWIGANDMGDAIAARLAGDANAVNDAIATTLGGIGNAIGTLAGAGARHFLVPNLPDLSLTPMVRAYGDTQVSALAQGASSAFNNSLLALLAGNAFTALDVDTLDVFSAQTAITNNPAAYGFSNVSSACYTGDPDGSPRPGWGSPTVCSDPTGYMYFDYQHPSSQLHQQIAQLAFQTYLNVPEPDGYALLLVGLGLGALVRRRSY